MVPIQTFLEDKETKIKLPHLVYLRDVFMTRERAEKIIASDPSLKDELLRIRVRPDWIE